MKDHSINEDKCRDMLNTFNYSFEDEDEQENVVDIFEHNISLI